PGGAVRRPGFLGGVGGRLAVRIQSSDMTKAPPSRLTQRDGGALAAPGRRDLLIPHDQVRNPAGTVIGCRTLAHVTTRQAATHPLRKRLSEKPLPSGSGGVKGRPLPIPGSGRLSCYALREAGRSGTAPDNRPG